MFHIRIAAVSYLNTLPFIYGIRNSGHLAEFGLELFPPSVCADKLLNGDAGIALLPVAVLNEMTNYEIVSGYCIGSNGPVRTVVLFSDVPMEEITAVYLDYQSRTSVLLVKILAQKHWKISPKWLKSTPGYEKNISGTISGLVIGDRVFELENKFRYKYDLGKEWLDFSGLPFVYACWVSNKTNKKEWLEKFNEALAFGVDSIDKVVLEVKSGKIFYPPHTTTGIDFNLYFTKNIIYILDDEMKEGMNFFLKILQEEDFAKVNAG